MIVVVRRGTDCAIRTPAVLDTSMLGRRGTGGLGPPPRRRAESALAPRPNIHDPPRHARTLRRIEPARHTIDPALRGRERFAAVATDLGTDDHGPGRRTADADRHLTATGDSRDRDDQQPGSRDPRDPRSAPSPPNYRDVGGYLPWIRRPQHSAWSGSGSSSFSSAPPPAPARWRTSTAVRRGPRPRRGRGRGTGRERPSDRAIVLGSRHEDASDRRELRPPPRRTGMIDPTPATLPCARS